MKWLAIGIGLLVTFILLIALWGSSGTQDAAEAIMADFNAGKIEEVYNNSVMTEDFTLEEFEAVMGVGSEWDITQAQKVSWVGRGFQNSEKYTYGRFLFSNNKEQIVTFWFVEINDELKLSGITGGEPDFMD